MKHLPWSGPESDNGVLNVYDCSGCLVLEQATVGPDDLENILGVVGAVNGTYGQGINPEAVKPMLEAAQEIVTLLDDPIPMKMDKINGVYRIARAAIAKAGAA